MGIAIGTEVVYRGGFGFGEPTRASVIGLGKKNGKIVYDLSDGHWCYGHQIDSVNTKINLN